MKRPQVIQKLMLASGFLLLWGCGNQEQQMQTTVEAPVSVEELALKSIEEYVVTTGTVTAYLDAELTSETAGFYRLGNMEGTNRPLELGDFVKKGQVIVNIDNPEQENTIRFESQKLSLEISKNEYEKQQSLFEKGGVTQRELKDSERSSMEAQYNYDNSLIQLSKLKITAPFDGLIVDLPYYTPGIKTGANSVMAHIMDYSTLTMEIQLPGKLLGLVKVNQPIRVMNYSLPDDILPGKISEVSPALNPETRTFKAKVSIENPDWLLRPGMFVKADIVTAHKDSALVIPKDIILSRRNRKSVYIVERGFAYERVIQTGLENPDEIEVIEGLNLNDRLVIEGFETLRSGTKVTITR